MIPNMDEKVIEHLRTVKKLKKKKKKKCKKVSGGKTFLTGGMRFHPSKLRSCNHQSAAWTLIIGKLKTVVQNEHLQKHFTISATLVGALGE